MEGYAPEPSHIDHAAQRIVRDQPQRATAAEQPGGEPPQESADTGMRKAGGTGMASGSVIEEATLSSEHVPAHASQGLRDLPPDTVEARLASLAPWQAGYVLALMETGGVMGMACVKRRVSRQSVEKSMKADPEFAAACAEAVAHSTDLVEAAVIRGATIGDLAPVYQGGRLVGYKRVRNTKDAELALTIRGRMPDQQVNVTHGGRVAILDEGQMAERLAEVARLLHGQPVMRAIEGKVVSEPDTKGA